MEYNNSYMNSLPDLLRPYHYLRISRWMWGGILYIIGERVPTVLTLLEECRVAITFSDKLNQYGVKTIKENKVIEDDEAYVPIVRN